MFVIEESELVYTSPVTGQRKSYPLDTVMGILYDKADGTLHKVLDYDSAAKVLEKWTRSLVDTNDNRALELANSLALEPFPITPEHIEEVNLCMQVTGRVKGISERFDRIVIERSIGTKSSKSPLPSM